MEWIRSCCRESIWMAFVRGGLLWLLWNDLIGVAVAEILVLLVE